MIGTLADALNGLNRREKALLALLVFGALPIALVFLVALPLLDNRDAAAARLAEARAEAAWVQARDADWQALTGSGAVQTTTQAPVGLSGIEETLTALGLRAQVATLENTDGGRVTLRLTAVPFVEMARFLEQIGPALGYRIDSLRVTATQTPGKVDLALDLAPAT